MRTVAAYPAGARTPTRARAGRRVGAIAFPAAAVLFFFLVCGPGDVEALHITGSAKLIWALADAFVCVLFLVQGRAMLQTARSSWPVLTWPALAMLSALWSLDPLLSLNHGVQLLMTMMIGFAAVSSAGLRNILLWLCVGLTLAGLASLALVVIAPGSAVGEDGAWAGAFTHKNQLGGFMVLNLITAVALILDGRHRWVGAAVVVLSLGLVLGSRSGTSLLALAAALALLPLAWAYRRGPAMMGLTAGAVMIGLSVMLALVLGDNADLVAGVLGGLGKDATLTGRTVLWQFGLDQIARTPVIGLGYKAYWESPATSAEYLRYVIAQRLWFFHNNFIDVGVAFGVVGLVVFTAGLVFAFVRTATLFFRQPDAVQLWRLMFMVFVTVEATAENPLFQNHSLLQLLMAIAVTPPLPARVPAPAPMLGSRTCGWGGDT